MKILYHKYLNHEAVSFLSFCLTWSVNFKSISSLSLKALIGTSTVVRTPGKTYNFSSKWCDNQRSSFAVHSPTMSCTLSGTKLSYFAPGGLLPTFSHSSASYAVFSITSYRQYTTTISPLLHSGLRTQFLVGFGWLLPSYYLLVIHWMVLTVIAINLLAIRIQTNAMNLNS